MQTTNLRLIQPAYIFQTGNELELSGTLIEGLFENRMVTGYAIPDTGDGASGILPADYAEAIRPIEAAEAYFGKCILTAVSNFYTDETSDQGAGEAGIGTVRKEQVQVVHYPDCQQLVFHMPKYAWDAGEIRLTDAVTGAVLCSSRVSDRLSGGTMIIWDTLPLKPGFYTIEADWPGGWTHRIRFIKMIPGFPKEAYRHPPGNVRMVQDDHTYRLFDSNGVEIRSGMEDLRQAILDKIAGSGRRLEYEQSGRAGIITYCEQDIRITFDWEFAGGNSVVYIFVPNPGQWEAATLTPLTRRQEILDFVGAQVVRDQAPSCTYRIEDGWIDVFKS
ncbi:MAG TPA: hypothetical protein PKE06_12720 [Flavilitoribacter sp.]|nr:hypothetical protein [Flavilitoribacter sp.]HMQ90392.1 hypothetical protein [Flavilitoribacter sp.]